MGFLVNQKHKPDVFDESGLREVTKIFFSEKSRPKKYPHKFRVLDQLENYIQKIAGHVNRNTQRIKTHFYKLKLHKPKFGLKEGDKNKPKFSFILKLVFENSKALGDPNPIENPFSLIWGIKIVKMLFPEQLIPYICKCLGQMDLFS